MKLKFKLSIKLEIYGYKISSTLKNKLEFLQQIGLVIDSY